MTGNVPEEDGVDHRADPSTVEPTVWLTDGSPENPPGTSDSEKLTIPGDSAPEADPLLAGDQIDDQVTPPVEMPLPAASYTSDNTDTPPPGDGLRIPPYQRQVPPYPAQVAAEQAQQAQQAPPVAPGVAARVTAPFAALGKQKSRKPVQPAQARTAAWSRPGDRGGGQASGSGAGRPAHRGNRPACGAKAGAIDAPGPARAGQDRALVGDEI